MPYLYMEGNLLTLSFINDEIIIQVCGTVFAGVLILLTIERKFEAKDVGPEYILKLKRTRDDISSYLQGKKTERLQMEEKKAISEKRVHDGKEDPRMLGEIDNDIAGVAVDIARAQREHDRTVATINQV